MKIHAAYCTVLITVSLTKWRTLKNMFWQAQLSQLLSNVGLLTIFRLSYNPRPFIIYLYLQAYNLGFLQLLQ